MSLAARGWEFDAEMSGPADGPPVLLLHGFPQDLREWDLVVPALHAAGLHTVAVNQRGYSAGARPDDPLAYRMPECVADAVALLDELGLDRAHLVGHDWGGLVAWHTAAEYPDRVATLTAIAVPHPRAIGDAMAAGADQKDRMAYIQLFRLPGKAERVLLDDDGRRLAGMFGGCPPERVAYYVDRMREPGALTAALNWYRAMTRFDSVGLGAITTPTTYVYGDGDLAIGEGAALNCARYVRGPYRFVRLAGISHWAPEQDPDRVAREIIARVNGTAISTDSPD